MEEQLFTLMGQVIFGGITAAGIAFAIFHYVGKQWVDIKFAERLGALSREHNALVARLRMEIEAMLKAKTLQERDFNALPGTWERLEKAYAGVRSIMRFSELRTNVKQMDIFELDELMGAMDWFQAEINLVKSVDGFVRQDEFDQISFGYQLRRVRDCCKEFNSFVAANAIFYPGEMLEELTSLGATLELALNEKEQAGARPKSRSNQDAPDAELPPPRLDEAFASRINAMAASIRKKLESHEQAVMV